MSDEALSNLAAAIKDGKKITITDPRVEIAQILNRAVEKLADRNNEVFTEYKVDGKFEIDETIDFALAVRFAKHPLAGLEARLKARGIHFNHKDGSGKEYTEEVSFRLDTLEEFILDLVAKRHSTNRARVKEYIEALDAMNKTLTPPRPEQEQRFPRPIV